jgi:hypothetical protein
MAKSESDIERDLQSLIGSFAIEDIVLDDEQIARCRVILSGDVDGEVIVAQLFEKFRAE